MTILNRRKFVRNASALAMGSYILPACVSKESTGDQESGVDSTATREPVASTGLVSALGLQLYSVRDVIEEDVQDVCQQLADMGYQKVESYPGKKGHYFGYEAKEFSDMLSGMGMVLVSTHIGYGKPNAKATSWREAAITSNFEAFVEESAKTGLEYVTCSSLYDNLPKTKADLDQVALTFNKAGEICQQAGMKFAFHNHDVEFKPLEDVIMIDYLMENTDPDMVEWELDMFWVEAAGQDTIAYLEKYPNRFKLCHIKDMDKENPKHNAVIGKGSMDYDKILKVAAANGMKHYLIEQESYKQTSLEAMRENYAYVSSIKA